MTHCTAGGVPVGCFLTTSETQASFEAALTMYKALLTPGGRGARGPQVIMTDDCVARKKAIGTCFPEAVALLCTFHVLQATWRWLWDGKQVIPRDDRPQLLQQLKWLMSAHSVEQLHDVYAEVTRSDVVMRRPGFASYLGHLVNRKNTWALCFRHELPVRGKTTNNYCEAGMRALKDNILGRTKAFNVMQVFHFVISRMEGYYQRRLIDAANNRLPCVSRDRYAAHDGKYNDSDI